MRAALLTAVAILLIGIGFVAILPPFEGFDEPAHYSSVRQIADTGTIPLFGSSYIDRAVEAYEQHAPMPWGAGKPPFDKTGYMTYQSFFADAAAVRYYKRYGNAPASDRFAPGVKGNWESQHPPLYYALMAPIMRATEGFSLLTQLFTLRLASFVLAWGGFVIGWLAARSYEGASIPSGIAAEYLYFPFLLPVFFTEFGRVGNDSLCLLLLGPIFGLTLAICAREKGGGAKSLSVGLLLGLGLLTKAFFLPILAGYACFMGIRAWQARDEKELFNHRLAALGLTTIPALIVGGGWYIYDFVAFGSPTGSGDSIYLARHGGFLANLLRHFSLSVPISRIIDIAVSWPWAGSWSLVHVAPALHIPLVILTGMAAIAYVMYARRYRLGEPIWLAAWLLVPFLAGLLYHVFVVFALGTSGTPVWYLDILAPFLALAFSCGFERLWRYSIGPPLIMLGLVYAACFLGIALWSQMALFAGCAVKNSDKLYQFTGHSFCLDRFSEITENLSVIAWPRVAYASIAGGMICYLLGLIAHVRYRPPIRIIQSAVAP